MEIIEQFIKGKNADPSLCEDMIFVSDDFIAVIDGATSKHPRLFNGKTGGRAAAEAVCNTLETLKHDTDVYEAVKKITKKIATLYEPNEEKCSAVASAVIYSKHKKEVWSIGDCQCIINGEKHLHEKEIDRILSEQRAQVLKEAVKNGATVQELLINDVGREAILPSIKDQHKFANTEGELGYGVFNGTPVPEKFIITYKLNKGDTVVLASDGYPFLCESLQESEKLLAKEIADNPLCYINYKSTKGLCCGNISFDDRAYIKLKI